jgi:hypothetical protein
VREVGDHIERRCCAIFVNLRAAQLPIQPPPNDAISLLKTASNGPHLFGPDCARAYYNLMRTSPVPSDTLSPPKRGGLFQIQ